MFKYIFLFLVFTLGRGEEIYISFQYSTKNYKLIYDNFNCSFSIINFSTQNGKLLFSLPYNDKSVIKFCYKNRENIIDNLLKQKIVFTSRDKIYNTFLETHKKLTFLPHKFDIIIKNGYAYFYLKEE